METSWVITAVGLVTTGGDNPEDLFGALGRGVSLAGFHQQAHAGTRAAATAPIAGFDPRTYMTRKGLKDLSRTSQLACAAAALVSRGIGAVDPARVGVAFGTAWGSMKTVVDFERAAQTEGSRFVDPLLFTETVSNVPAGQVSIFQGWSAFNGTLSAGSASGLEALRWALDLLEDGRAALAVAGGGDELNPPLLRTLLAQGATSAAGECSPYGVGRSGLIGGEGACLLALEPEEGARQRGVRPRARIRSAEGCFAGGRGHPGRGHPAGDAIESPGLGRPAGGAAGSCGEDRPAADPGGSPGGGRTSRDAAGSPAEERGGDRAALRVHAAELMRRVLDGAGLRAQEIDLLVLSGNGSPEGDREEALAVMDVFGQGPQAPPVVAPKAILGETWGASGPIAVVTALEAIRTATVPGRARGTVLDPDLAGLNLPGEKLARPVRNAMALECARTGHFSCMIVSEV